MDPNDEETQATEALKIEKWSDANAQEAGAPPDEVFVIAVEE